MIRPMTKEERQRSKEREQANQSPTVLIDGDIVAYRAAFYAEDKEAEDAEDKVDDVMEWILQETTFDGIPYEVFLTGGGNFRYDISQSYKANRTGEKPLWLAHVRDYMIEHWGAVVSDGEEADDLIAIRATELGPHTVVASVDKDFLQIPCRHYNFGKGEWATVEKFDGLKFFYSQVLTGDRADNVIGLYRVGPVKAAKILDGAETEMDLFNRCVEAYDGDVDKVIENARLLWLRRYKDEIWQPPE